MDEVVAIAGEKPVARCQLRRRLRCEHTLFTQVVEQRCQRRQRRNPPLAGGPPSVQELLRRTRREHLDAKALGGEPAIELAHQRQGVLHRCRRVANSQQPGPEPVCERDEGPTPPRP